MLNLFVYIYLKFTESIYSIIAMLIEGEKLFNKIYPLINKEEELIFNKLQNETFNFTNSLKLLLGMKLRIKVKNHE